MNSNRYLLFIALGMAPLSLLTLRTIGGGLSGQHAADQAADAATLATNLGEAKKAAQDAAADQRNLLGLASAAARPLQSSPVTTDEAPSKQLSAVFDRWQNVRKTRDAVRSLCLEMQLFSNLSEAADSVLAQLTAKLEKLREQSAKGNTPGGEQLCQAIDLGLADLARERQQREAAKVNRGILEQAQAAFAAKRYDECLRLLATWTGPPSDEIDSLQSALQLLKEVMQIEDKLAVLEKSQPSESWLPVLESVRRLVPDESAGALDPDSAARWREIQKRLAVLDARYYLETLTAPEDPRDWRRRPGSVSTRIPRPRCVRKSGGS